ncbi:MAG: hypothetical protein LUE96_03690 [Lachnospiraceae bacterium]|nr:hypothetical protein [Lachnospiraceae bacterium]
MVRKEEYDRIIDELKECEKVSFKLENGSGLSMLENKNVFMIRSVREETFRQILSKLNKQAPNCKLCILGRAGDGEILKQEFPHDYRLFEVHDDKQYDVAGIGGILDEIRAVNFNACLFMTKESISFSQVNLMEILYKLPCSMKGVVTKHCKVNLLQTEWERYIRIKADYDMLCDEIWKMYD